MRTPKATLFNLLALEPVTCLFYRVRGVCKIKELLTPLFLTEKKPFLAKKPQLSSHWFIFTLALVLALLWHRIWYAAKCLVVSSLRIIQYQYLSFITGLHKIGHFTAHEKIICGLIENRHPPDNRYGYS